MAGHSKFKNIMHRKGAQDKKRASLFTKLAKEITVAAKEGGDPSPDNNARLRTAIQNARGKNMPNDNIDRAVKKAFGAEGDVTYTSLRYEGYGPAGVSVIVEALTDNKNRTASDVRSTFSKRGGSLGETNSVSFSFDHLGMVTYDSFEGSFDTFLETALDFGCIECEEEEESVFAYSEMSDFHALKQGLEAAFGAPSEASIIWKPQNIIHLSGEALDKAVGLYEALDDLDDVQSVFVNFESE